MSVQGRKEGKKFEMHELKKKNWSHYPREFLARAFDKVPGRCTDLKGTLGPRGDLNMPPFHTGRCRAGWETRKGEITPRTRTPPHRTLGLGLCNEKINK